MNKICDCCGQKLSFNDLEYEIIKIDDKECILCSKCKNNFQDYKNGLISINKVVYDFTNPSLKKYIEKYAPAKDITESIIQKEEQENKNNIQKEENKRINPLYDDIHQLANDVHSLKIIIIICITLYIISIFINLFFLH